MTIGLVNFRGLLVIQSRAISEATLPWGEEGNNGAEEAEMTSSSLQDISGNGLISSQL